MDTYAIMMIGLVVVWVIVLAMLNIFDEESITVMPVEISNTLSAIRRKIRELCGLE